MQRRAYPGSVPFTQMGPLKLEEEDMMKSTREAVQKKTDLPAVEERRRWDRSAKARKMRANGRLDEDVPAARELVAVVAGAAWSGEEGSVVAFEDSVALASESAAGAVPADVRTVQVAGDVGSKRSTRGVGAHREERKDVTAAASGGAGQMSAAAIDAVAVGAPA